MKKNLYKETGKQFHIKGDKLIIYGNHLVTDDIRSAETYQREGKEVLKVGNVYYVGKEL